MNRQDLYERVVVSLQDAALDDTRWPETAGLIDELCGARGNFLVSGDGATQEEVDIFFARFCFRGARDPDLEREYFRVWHAIDERLPRIRVLPDSRIVPNASLFAEQERKTSAVYNELMPRTGTRNCLVARLDGPDGSRIVWAVGDPVGGGGWPSSRVETIGRLLPHIRQYVRVRHTLAGARALGSAAAGLLETMRIGVIHLDWRGRVVEANDLAGAHLRGAAGLRDRDGVLHAALSEEDAELHRLVAQALPGPGGPGTGGSMLVSGESLSSRLLVHVNPVGRNGIQYSESGGIGALVLVIDPASRAKLDGQALGTILGLTPVESSVAVALVEGKSTGEIAAETGRSAATVKWHTRKIFAKHGLSRKADLVWLAMSLTDGPVSGARVGHERRDDGNGGDAGRVGAWMRSGRNPGFVG